MAERKKEGVPVYRCTKEDKIDGMEKDIKELNQAVFKGTNGDSLKSMAATSIENQRKMDDKLWMMDSNLVMLMKFQTKVETERDIKHAIREKKLKKQQRLISLMSVLIGALVGLGGILIAIFKT